MSNQIFMFHLQEAITDRSLVLTDKINSIALKSLRKILEFLELEKIRQNCDVVRLPLTKKETAEKFGVQRTSLNRELNKMERNQKLKKELQEEKTVQNRIIDTAVPLFAMKGYAGVSVRELAKEAGINIALISYYFGGKEKLYTYILSSHFNIIESALSNIQKKELSPKDKIISFHKQITVLQRKYPYLIRLAISEIINPTICYENIVKNGIVKLTQFLKNCVAEGIEAGDFRNDIDPAVVALSFISVINFYFLTWPLGDDLLQKKDSKTEYYIGQAFDNYFLGILNTEKK